MTKFTHTVTAEMVDAVTGERKFPGEGFTPHNEDQEKRLIAAHCLKEGAPPKAEKGGDTEVKPAADDAQAAPASAKSAAAKPAAAPAAKPKA